MDCQETYTVGTPCLRCLELQTQVDALKQQAEYEAIRAEVRMSIFRAIKDAVDVALK